MNKLGFRKIFENRVRKFHPDSWPDPIDRTDREYYVILPDVFFAKTSANPLDRRLIVSAYFLAYIKSLDKAGHYFDQIRLICHKTVIDYVKPKNKLHKWLKKIPVIIIGSGAASWFLKLMDKKPG